MLKVKYAKLGIIRTLLVHSVEWYKNFPDFIDFWPSYGQKKQLGDGSRFYGHNLGCKSTNPGNFCIIRQSESWAVEWYQILHILLYALGSCGQKSVKNRQKMRKSSKKLTQLLGFARKFCCGRWNAWLRSPQSIPAAAWRNLLGNVWFESLRRPIRRATARRCHSSDGIPQIATFAGMVDGEWQRKCVASWRQGSPRND